MSASECQALQSTALEVAAALDAYERHVRQLVSSWLDMDLYHAVSGEIDAVRSLCAALPELSLPWVSLLVSHAELVHCLWRSTQPAARPVSGELQARLEEHLQCITVLAERSRQLADQA
jgi:hypothetical protein